MNKSELKSIIKGIINEIRLKPGDKNLVKGTEMFKEYAIADYNLEKALKAFDSIYKTSNKYTNQIYDQLMETPPVSEIHNKTRAVWYVIFDGNINGVITELEAEAKLEKNRGTILTIDQLVEDGFLERV